jgi:hypothetical protein
MSSVASIRPSAALRSLGVAYVLSAVVVTAAHLGTGWPSAGAVALTPDLLARGKVWLLATSAFLVDSESLLSASLALLALAASVVYLRGSRRFLWAALAGHLGATVIVYAGIGILLLAHVGGVRSLLDEPDYGTSCVWTGVLGAAAVQAWRDRRRAVRIAVPLAALAAVGALTWTSDGLALPEHLLAFVLGALVVLSLRGSANREVTEHRRLVRLAVELVRARGQLERHRLRAHVGNGREVLREAVRPVEREAVDGRVVVNDEGVAPGGQRLDRLSALRERDLEGPVRPRRADQLRARGSSEGSRGGDERDGEHGREGCGERVTTLHGSSVRRWLRASSTAAARRAVSRSLAP